MRKTIVTLAVLSFASAAQANVFLELDPGVPFQDIGPGGEGQGRSIYFTADEAFTMKGAGIFGDLIAKSYDLVLYQGIGVGNPAGPVLVSATQNSGGLGLDWNDIPLDYTFTPGRDYIIHWRPTDGQAWTAGVLRYFFWDNSPVDLGIVTIIDGREGFNSENGLSNVAAPFMRLINEEIPAPGGLAVLAMAGLIARRRRR